MAQIITIQDREGGACYPVTSTKAVIDEKGVDLDTRVNQLQQKLAKKQDTFSTSEDMQLEGGLLALTDKFKGSKLDKEVFERAQAATAAAINSVNGAVGAIDSTVTDMTTDASWHEYKVRDTEDVIVSRNESVIYTESTANTALSLDSSRVVTIKTDNNSAFATGDMIALPHCYITDEEGETTSVQMKVVEVLANGGGINCVITNIAENSMVIGNVFIGTPIVRHRYAELGLTEKAKMRLFCDMFNAAVGDYGYARITDGVFDCKLNELTLTYEEAIDTMSEPRIRGDYTTSNSNQFLYSRATFRTHLPKTAPERISRCQYTFIGAQKLEVVNARIIPLELCFTECKNLKKINIYQLIGSASSEAQRAYDNCKALSYIYVEMMGKYDVNLKWSPLITKESFQRIIAATPSNVTNAGGYTITVHADVFAKLTDETNAEWNQILIDAAAKNIAFATT